MPRTTIPNSTRLKLAKRGYMQTATIAGHLMLDRSTPDDWANKGRVRWLFERGSLFVHVGDCTKAVNNPKWSAHATPKKAGA